MVPQLVNKLPCFLRDTKSHYCVSSETSTAVTFQVVVFWIVTPGSVLEVYQRFGDQCCLHMDL